MAMYVQTELWKMDNQVTELTMDEILSRKVPRSGEIQTAMMKCFDQIHEHEKIMVSISGGYDSDILMDMIIRCGGKRKSTFAFNDTGLEYDATKEHVEYLENQYGVDIIRLDPKKAIPTCCREYGVPFWSKYVSSMISRLQKHGFRWEDKALDVLIEEYPNCRSALRWWCNDFATENGRPSKFNIEWTPGLKEFMIQHPPDFPISARCCEWAKKRPAHDYLINGGFDLNVTGVRKAEGGQRSTTYKSCFDRNFGEADNFRPLFWLSDRDKDQYRRFYGIIRSDCYEVWGMKRTGCAGCPLGKAFEEELELVKLFEPKRYRAMLAVFGRSYDYTRRFLEFRKNLKIKAPQKDKMQTEIEGVR